MNPTSARQIPPTHTGSPASSDTAQWCLAAIRQDDPAAALFVYSTFAARVRAYLRRHTGIQNVEEGVYSVLLETLRSFRESQPATFDDLAHTVRDLAQQGVFALRRRAAHECQTLCRMNLEARQQLVSGLFSVLQPHERDILLRSYVLSQGDHEISAALALPIHQISRTRAKARILLRMSTEQGHEYDPAAIA